MGHATVRKDPDAQADFRKRHGIINADVPIGNAEALIRAHNASQSRAVQKASLLAINNEATADLDLGDLSDQLGGDEVQAAAVRGNAIVVVALDENGRSYKTVLPANDRYKAPDEDEADTAQQAMTDAELNFQAEVIRLRAEQEAEIQKLRDELAAEQADQIAKLREEIFGAAEKRAEKAAEKAQADDGADGTEGDGTDVAPGGGDVAANDPLQGGGPKSRASTSRPRRSSR